MTRLYGEYFRMPLLGFQLTPSLIASSVLAAAAAAVIGSLLSVRSVVKLAPAEAMRPAAPPRASRAPRPGRS